MNKTVIIAVVLVIVAGIGGFFAGKYYQASQTASRFAQFGGAVGGQGGQFYRKFGQGDQRGQGMNVVRGQVVSTDSNTITLKLPNGSTKIIVVGSSANIYQSTKGTLSDLKAGDTLNIFGTANSDGSVTAQNIQINPIMQRFMQSAMPTK